MTDAEEAARLFRDLVEKADLRGEQVSALIQRLVNAGLLNQVTVHRYVCRRGGCVRGIVLNLGGRIYVRTRDYHLAPAANSASSVEAARRKNTLDGDRHWPGADVDVDELATWGDHAAVGLNCRHGRHNETGSQILEKAKGVLPGHPGAPTLL